LLQVQKWRSNRESWSKEAKGILLKKESIFSSPTSFNILTTALRNAGIENNTGICTLNTHPSSKNNIKNK
jgi:hypothetical protein